MEEKLEFRKIRDFSSLIGDTFLFIKQNFKPLGKAFLYLCGIFIVIGMITNVMTLMQINGFQLDVKKGAYDYKPQRIFLKFFGQYALQFVFLILCYTSVYTTVISYISLYISEKNTAPSIEEVWSYYKYYFFRILFSSIGMSIILVIAFFLCIIPGIYFFPAFTLFFPIMILENATFGYSFNRALTLIKDNWMQTAGAILIIWIITYACSSLIQMPALIISFISGFTNAEKPISNTYAIVSSVAQYISMVFMVIPIICATLIYYNLTERKESIGLMDRIDGLGNNNTNTNLPAEEY
jgi:hypothetical protein